MNQNWVKILLGVKFFLVSGFIAFYLFGVYAQEDSKSTEATEASAEEESEDEEEETVAQNYEAPEIPKGNITLEQGAALREQLEIMRRDVEAKIAQLSYSKAAYDRSKQDVEVKLQKIEEERKLLEETLQKEKKAKEERLSEALTFIAKMEPRKAGPIIEAMDKDLALLLMRKLPQKQVTKILESVSARKATEMMEYYTRIRSVREYELLKELGLCQVPLGDEKEPKSATNTTGTPASSPAASAPPAAPTATPPAAPPATPAAPPAAKPAG